MFGRVMPFEACCQAMSFFRLEGFIERTWPMGVQVVNDQEDALGLKIIFVREQAQVVTLLRADDKCCRLMAN